MCPKKHHAGCRTIPVLTEAVVAPFKVRFSLELLNFSTLQLLTSPVPHFISKSTSIGSISGISQLSSFWCTGCSP